MNVWYGQQHLSSQSLTPDNPADRMRQKACLCPYVLSKQACEVEWTWLTTELLCCSYAGTVKAMEAKHPAHPLSRIFSTHRHCAQDREFQRPSQAEYKRLVCRGQQSGPVFIAGSRILFFNWRTTQQAATTVWHILGFLLLREMWPWAVGS